jgi:hypothetical protein
MREIGSTIAYFHHRENGDSRVMRMVLALYLLFGVHIFGCSNRIEGNNAAPFHPRPTENAVLPTAVNVQETPGSSSGSTSPDQRDVVLFDGKNYIKKSGWKTPSKDDTYIDGSYDQGSVERQTRIS